MKTKIIENYQYSDRDKDTDHLIENQEKKCLDSNADKHYVWLSLSPAKSPSIFTSRHCLCFQLSIVCVLLLFCLCFILLILGQLSDDSKQSINKLIDRFADSDSSVAINQTDIFDTLYKTKLRHGSVRVITHCGTFFGGKEYDAFVFKGIPYAHPPVGDRRWTPPEVLCNPESHRHCNKFGFACFQVNPISGVEGREDCLYLNVWTPTIDPEADLSVMVWVHGGFLQFGSGHQPGLKPNGKLATKTNTVYVSLNYRLLAFGFLALDLLEDNSHKSTNFGLMDVILALQWIQHNIKSFGGSPSKVTLFGADSGAALILALMTNPGHRTLFRSVWLIDAAVYFDKSIAKASKENTKSFLKRTNCKTIDCLRSLSAQHIIRAFIGKNDPSFRIIDQNDLPILGIMSEQLITVDKTTLVALNYQLRPLLVIAETLVKDSFPFASIANDIPILIGSSSQAIAAWPGPKDLAFWSWDDYSKYVTTSMDSFGPRLSQRTLELYKPWHTSTDSDSEEMMPQLQYITMVSDLRQICPINYLSEVLAISGKNDNLFRYVINTRLSKAVRVYEHPVNYSFHLSDAMAFFGQLDVWIRWPAFNDYSISETIQQIVMAFVDRNNDSDNSFHWHSFPAQVAQVVSQLNYTSIVTTNYRQTDRCRFWRSEQFFNYMWTV